VVRSRRDKKMSEEVTVNHLTTQWAKVASRPVIAYPTTDGKGKWHASTSSMAETPLCGSTTALLDIRSGNRIHVGPTDKYAHPIVCKRCLRMSGWTPS
jgi:hypothetical protein